MVLLFVPCLDVMQIVKQVNDNKKIYIGETFLCKEFKKHDAQFCEILSDKWDKSKCNFDKMCIPLERHLLRLLRQVGLFKQCFEMFCYLGNYYVWKKN